MECISLYDYNFAKNVVPGWDLGRIEILYFMENKHIILVTKTVPSVLQCSELFLAIIDILVLISQILNINLISFVRSGWELTWVGCALSRDKRKPIALWLSGRAVRHGVETSGFLLLFLSFRLPIQPGRGRVLLPLSRGTPGSEGEPATGYQLWSNTGQTIPFSLFLFCN